MTDTPTVTVTPSSAPGPGGRVQRMSGQIGGSLIILDVWFAFGWFGSDDWTERQVLAVSAIAYWLVGASHNVWNWYTTRNQPKPAPPEVTVTAEMPAKRRGRDAGHTTLPILIGACAAVLLLALLNEIDL